MDLHIYATCPQSKDVPGSEYLDRVAEVARWSEQAGCTGILVYTDNGLVDPWLVSQIIIQSTQHLNPLVAVQPVYMHPYTAAKQVASLAYLHGRPVHLNMLAGGFRNDLLALGDETPHDERYARTIEYTQIVMGLLRDDAGVTCDGTYYGVANLRLSPSLPRELFPEVLVSGSSPAGLAAAEILGAVPVKYPKPPGEEAWASGGPTAFGVRVGIIAREDAEEAWNVALERFPEDRTGRITHRLAMQVSDSHWHRQLSDRQVPDARTEQTREVYWLGPFTNYKTFCPYLVGSYEQVAEVVARYVELGARTLVLDVPASQQELKHTGMVLALARESRGLMA